MGFVKTHAVGLAAMGLYALAWAASAYALYAGHSDDFEAALVILPVMGIGFSLVAWLATMGERAPVIAVRRPGLELWAMLAFLALYAVLFTGFGLNAFHAAFKRGRLEQALLLALKLVVHVGLPALVLMAVGGRVRPLLTARVGTRGFWICLVVIGGVSLAFMTVISPSLKDIANLHFSPLALAEAGTGTALWLAAEAGLCEEFLFRAVLQSRLAAAMKSEAGAVFVAGLLFALAHVPGLYMRADASVSGHSQSLIQVVAYAIAVLSPIGLSLGFVWARTRSFLLIVVLHTLIDLLPAIPDFARTWM